MPVKVSVIVPVYNPGAYIDDCIASILRQSLPADEYEAIFVDDGSTDGTGARLDALAAEHANITAIHIPNSGWPGRPRNVGIDAAAGKYVYFVDNDDWIGDEALERLYERAERNDADVVVGKEVGHGKGVSRALFHRDVDDATLTATPLLELLTPHKFFRRAFLDEHGIRFPEGRRRLEDHVFVMKAFFKARRISILADYPCYHWLLRKDAGNATDLYSEPRGYYMNVREILDIVDEHTDSGPDRDRLYAHWYRGKALHRLRGARWATTPDARGLAVYAEVRRLALERFGPGVDKALSTKFRVLSRSVRADRVDLVTAQAKIERGIRAAIALTSLEWTDRRLRLSLTAGLTYANGMPIALERRAGRIYWRPPAPLGGDPTILEEDLDVTAEIARTKVAIVLRNREALVEFEARAKPRNQIGAEPGLGEDPELMISAVLDADIDVGSVATGSELAPGVWDLFVHVQSCGWSAISRLTAVGHDSGSPRIVIEPHVTQFGNLSVKVRDPTAENQAAERKAEDKQAAEQQGADKPPAETGQPASAAAASDPGSIGSTLAVLALRTLPAGFIRFAVPALRRVRRWR
ncbi:MAG: glycosyltransferase [Chloroflexi bacterium]|nr:glycosyltransferase [Chloroflexota bacterium]